MFPNILEEQSSPFTRMQTFKLRRGISSSSDILWKVKAYLFGESS